ncbi:outer membrane beta-barrel protein [Cysteiniphilum sp. QT6929]|uniref:outer membrane beta-barrel protein n=1 Tax=Cysteiniphilum sp. QT6929 TaxID=2975055 RepID=UPI0024B372F2|nr:outer membrane beta-barrel protein [Cysteiniphilum sp. QT6929]WHN65196.1 porin family protein [Cysteiniphilum sp. QT6929]
MKKIIATTVAAAALISGSAFAAGAQTGLVLGGNVGYAYSQNGWLKNANNLPGGKNGNIAGGLLIGYDFALSPMFSVGVELGGQYFNKIAKNDAGKLNMWSVPLFATAKFYIPGAMGLNVFGKAGYAYNKLTGDTDGMATNLWRPVAATGLGFQISQINIFAQYQYNWLPLYGYNAGESTVSVGLTYTLPM